MTVFRRLLVLFQARFFENDTVSPDGGFETNIWQVLGFLAAPGLFITYLFMPWYLRLATQHVDLAGQLALRMFRLFFPAFSFAVVGFATFFQWDKLLPDRRDFLILGSFPIRLRTLLGASVSALLLFLLMLTAAINLFPNILAPLLSLMLPEVRAAGYWRVAGSQIGATAGSSLFAFFAVAAFQGVLMNVTTPRVFRRMSPWIQAAGMSLMILSLVLYPVYAMMLPVAAMTRAPWLWYFPPIWFTGWYDLLLPPAQPLFASLGRLACLALAIAIGIFGLTWGLGFRRYYRRSLETDDSGIHKPGRTFFGRLQSSFEEKSIFRFTGSILARSAVHRLFLASYWSVGISIGMLTAVVVRNGKVGCSDDGLRSFPLLIVFFVVSGFRAAFQFPAELASNWLFRITEQNWAETARRASRARVLVNGLVPALLAFLPLEIAKWGVMTGLFHAVFQLASGAVLVEVLFWNFDKVPFTCSYFPGTINLALLAGIYIYGFTSYSFQMADLELALEGSPLRMALFFPAVTGVIVLFRRRQPTADAVRFDGNDPEIQTLDLS